MAFGVDDLIGYLAGKGSRDRAGRQLTANREEWERFDPNSTAAQTSGTEFDRVNLDPATRNAQMQALQQMAGIANAGGMDPQSVAALRQTQAANAQQAAARNQAVLEQAQAQGRLNSGRALSAQMQANQAAANSNAMAGTQAAADARTRALQAIANTGQMAGGVHAQDYGEAANRAQAQDLINRYNAGNQQQTNLANQQAQFSKQEQLANSNKDLANFNLGNTQAINGIAQGFGNAVSTVAKGLTGI